MLNVHDVAAYFLTLSGSGLGHMKLQKLCYLAQAHHLGAYGAPLFDDTFRAFKYGPVSDALWRRHRYTQGLIAPGDVMTEIGADERTLLDSVYIRYACHTPWELSKLTHQDEPFLRAWAAAQDRQSDVMDNDAIRVLYADRLIELDTDEPPPFPDPEEVRQMVNALPEVAEAWRAVTD